IVEKKARRPLQAEVSGNREALFGIPPRLATIPSISRDVGECHQGNRVTLVISDRAVKPPTLFKKRGRTCEIALLAEIQAKLVKCHSQSAATPGSVTARGSVAPNGVFQQGDCVLIVTACSGLARRGR